MKASEIIGLLAERHAGGVFVSECKDGPSQCSTHLRMDGWAMNKSWSNPLVCGYEVKVSRRDFIGDKKWHLYLPLCNEFYFVCPSKLIDPTELPESAGLIYVSKTGTKLFIKKKAPRRDVKIPEDVFRYILMCRTEIKGEYDDKANAKARWQAWMQMKKEDRDFGRVVGGEIKRTIEQRIEAVDKENERLKRENEKCDDIRQMLARIGLSDAGRWEVQRHFEDLMRAVPRDLERTVDAAAKTIVELQQSLRKLSSTEKELVAESA